MNIEGLDGGFIWWSEEEWLGVAAVVGEIGSVNSDWGWRYGVVGTFAGVKWKRWRWVEDVVWIEGAKVGLK